MSTRATSIEQRSAGRRPECDNDGSPLIQGRGRSRVLPRRGDARWDGEETGSARGGFEDEKVWREWLSEVGC